VCEIPILQRQARVRIGLEKSDRPGIKGDEEIGEPSPENVKKHEFAVEYFQRLNEWLHKDGSLTRYQFNMLTLRGYGIFFTKLRSGKLVGFRSELDVAMARATVGT
jgi:type III restriction enzyme